MLQSAGQRLSASVHETSSALLPKYSTTGAGALLDRLIQPRRRIPSSATISSGVAAAGRCVVETIGCGKKTSRSCASHAAIGTPKTIANSSTSQSMYLRRVLVGNGIRPVHYRTSVNTRAQGAAWIDVGC